MKAPSPLIAAAFGLGFVIAQPVAAADPAHAEQAKHAPAKPERGQRTAPPVRAAMRATLQADGSLTYECLTVPHPRHATTADEPTPQQLREER